MGSPPITTTPCPGLRLLRNQTWSFQTRSRPPPLPAPSEPPLLHISGCILRRETNRERWSDRKRWGPKLQENTLYMLRYYIFWEVSLNLWFSACTPLAGEGTWQLRLRSGGRWGSGKTAAGAGTTQRCWLNLRKKETDYHFTNRRGEVIRKWAGDIMPVPVRLLSDLPAGRRLTEEPRSSLSLALYERRWR